VARVLTVNPETLELTVVSSVNPGGHITVRIAEENDLPRKAEQVFFPGCVTSGATIRLWGNSEQTKDMFFIATDIRGCRNGGCSDPTGVRSRLWKIRHHKYGTVAEGANRSGTSDGGGRGNGGNGGGEGDCGGGGGGR